MHRANLIEAVYRTERARVLATTIRVTHGDFALAEEIVQETFAAAVSRWPLEGTPHEPLAWLISVARNKAIDSIRRNIKLRELLVLAQEDEADTEAELHATVYPHPTMSEAMHEASLDAYGKVLHI